MSPASPRRRRGLAVVAGLLALGLVTGTAAAACGSSGSSSSTGTTTDGSTPSTVVNTSSLDDVTVSTDLATKPTVTFDPSYAGDGDAVKVVVPGTGPAVAEGQLVTFDFVSISGVDGSETQTNWGSTQASPSVLLSSNQILPVVSQALVGQPVGSRVLAATDQAGQTSGVWTLFVFDIKSAVTPLDGPQGTPVTPADGLPTVTVTDGKPTISMPSGTAPTSLVVQPLIKGDGAVVEAGQTVVVNYVGAKYADGSVFDSSFDRGSAVDFQIGVNQVIPGWDEGIVGQTVGSRLLLVIPPDKGYGTTGNSSAGISGTDTLVFVVDILAAG
jgi:peptidylprolyl isomerase